LSLATATEVVQWHSSYVLKDSGDFATFINPSGHPSATMAAPWIFTPSTSTPALWSIGGFTFDLFSSTVLFQSTTFLNITGAGTVSGNSFDPTPGTWSFTVSRANGQTSESFGFQANTEAVPEASTTSLLTIGVLGLAGMCLWRRKSANFFSAR
jgi:hypothetical protein